MIGRLLGLTLLGLCLAVPAHALTLEWDRNAEPDMLEYRIYVCTTPGCKVVISTAARKASVPQVAEGKIPSWVVPSDLIGKPGAVAISARDKSGNQSALSVQLPFDDEAPAVPTNPRFK